MTSKFGFRNPPNREGNIQRSTEVESPKISADDKRLPPPIPIKQMSPSELAAWNLFRELLNYPNISKDLRQQ